MECALHEEIFYTKYIVCIQLPIYRYRNNKLPNMYEHRRIVNIFIDNIGLHEQNILYFLLGIRR